MIWSIALIRKTWWPITLGCALAATAYLRIAGADSAVRMSWMQLQAKEQRAADDSGMIRYLCVNNFAFDLGKGARPIVFGEDSIFIVDAEIKKRCLLPWMPVMDDAQLIVSATAPSSGYGAAMIEIDSADSTRLKAVDKVHRYLENSGWYETGASEVLKSRDISSAATAYERDGAWLLVVDVQPFQNGNTVLLAGRYDPGVMKK